MSSVSPKMSVQEMVALNREYVFFTWSVQSAVSPIVAEQAVRQALISKRYTASVLLQALA